ncbi:hypothetical protein PENSPDRAFT_693939 [Peniophora sp. CONT]|nr:hypothetical protein PENSPDRAFT_693939 [Peniophora sp. CONT]
MSSVKTEVADNEGSEDERKLRRSLTKCHIPGVRSYYPVEKEPIRGVYTDWGSIKPLLDALCIRPSPKRYDTYEEAEAVLAASSPEAVLESLRALGFKESPPDARQLSAVAAPHHPPKIFNVHEHAPPHISVQLEGSTATTRCAQHACTSSINSWRSDVYSATSEVSTITSSTLPGSPSSPTRPQASAPPVTLSITAMEAELQALGVADAQALPAEWRVLRGSRPRGGWKVFAVLSGRQRGIIHNVDTAHESTDKFPNAIKEGFRAADEWLARAWLRDAVTRRYQTTD